MLVDRNSVAVAASGRASRVAVMAERFNAPPGWHVPPGFEPPQGWQPDPSWPPAPEGWVWWVAEQSPAPGTRTSEPGTADPRTPYAQPPSPYLQPGAGPQASGPPQQAPRPVRRRAVQSLISGLVVLAIAVGLASSGFGSAFGAGNGFSFIWLFAALAAFSVVRSLVTVFGAGRSRDRGEGGSWR